MCCLSETAKQNKKTKHMIEVVVVCFLFVFDPPERGSTGGSWPTCPLEPASEFRVQRSTQGVSKQLHNTTWGPRDPTPRTCQAGPPTTLAPATQTNVRSGLQFPPHLRRGSIPTSTIGLHVAGSNAAGPPIPMVGNHRDILHPADPVGSG